MNVDENNIIRRVEGFKLDTGPKYDCKLTLMQIEESGSSIEDVVSFLDDFLPQRYNPASSFVQYLQVQRRYVDGTKTCITYLILIIFMLHLTKQFQITLEDREKNLGIHVLSISYNILWFINVTFYILS